jgi:hypothetical protein
MAADEGEEEAAKLSAVLEFSAALEFSAVVGTSNVGFSFAANKVLYFFFHFDLQLTNKS